MAKAKLSRLFGKEGKLELEDGSYIPIKPLTLDDIDVVIDLENPEKRSNAIKEIVKRTLKRAYPDASDEEIKQVSMQYFEKLVNKIVEVSNLKVKGIKGASKGASENF